MGSSTYPPDAEVALYKERINGRARTGVVGLRNFDQGIVETLGATIVEDDYVLQIEGIDAPPGESGIPITFSVPEDVFENFLVPVIVIRRESINPSMNRWQPGGLQYRAPAPGALPVTYMKGTSYEKHGFNKMEQLQVSVPFDIDYTISIIARHRGLPKGQRNQANRILDYILRIYPPYCLVKVKDDLGDTRTYEAFTEAISSLDAIPEVSERTIGFALSVRVMAELDLIEPDVFTTVMQPLKITEKVI